MPANHSVNFVDTIVSTMLGRAMSDTRSALIPRPAKKDDRTPMARLEALLSDTISITQQRLNADRVSLFFYNREKCELWSVLSQEKKIMRIDARLGIAGHVARTGETINVDDAYEHPLFHKVVDLQTGYRTRTLLAVPVRNSTGEIVGVAEAINKAIGLFSDDDSILLQSLAARAATAMESTNLAKEFVEYDPDDVFDTEGEFSTRQIVGMNRQLESTIRLIDMIRDNSIEVLIQGENGTGKEAIAKALHYTSQRAAKPFVAVNSAGLTDTISQSELFGHEKGAFTGADRQHIGYFESAQGGTIFLDEIGDMSLDAQKSILRALTSKKIRRLGGTHDIAIDVRVVAATNKNLEAAMRDGTFRTDLYFRLNVISMKLPPLREIVEDIPRLVGHFLAKHGSALKTPIKALTDGALQRLCQYSWPGNIRQLENEIKRLTATVRGRLIGEEHLDPSMRAGAASLTNTVAPTPAPPPVAPLPGRPALADALDRLAKQMIEDALRDTHGNKQQAAKQLGVSRAGLIKMMRRLRIGAPTAAD